MDVKNDEQEEDDDDSSFNINKMLEQIASNVRNDVPDGNFF